MSKGYNGGMYHKFLFDNIMLPSPERLGLGLVFVGVMVLVALWSLVWKVQSVWKAARAGSKWWFVVLLVVNTLGILDILYIYVFSKRKLRDIMKPARPVSGGPVEPV